MNLYVLTLENSKGLHARASAKFVETVEQFDAQAVVSRDGLNANGASLMGLLMLAASFGSTIHVETSGPEADALGLAIKDLLARKFDEEA